MSAIARPGCSPIAEPLRPFFLPTVGYALFLSFSSVSLQLLTLFDIQGSPSPLIQTFALFGILGAKSVSYLAFLFLAPRIKANAVPILPLFSCATALIGLTSGFIAMSYLADIEIQQLLPCLVFTGACLGTASVTTELAWAQFCCSLSRYQVFLFVLVCSGISILIGFVCTALFSARSLLVVMALVFVLAACCAYKALRSTEKGARHSQAASEVTRMPSAQKNSNIWQPIIGASLFSFMAGLMMQIMGKQGAVQGNLQTLAFVATGLVIAVMLLPALFTRKLPDLNKVFSIALLILATGFVLLPLSGSQTTGIMGVFAQLGSMVSTIALWCILAQRANAQNRSALRIYCPALLCTSLSQLAGIVAGWLRIGMAPEESLSPTIVALVAMYALVVVSPLVFRRQEHQGKAEHPEDGMAVEISNQPAKAPGCEYDPIHIRCYELAHKHALTIREQDVLEALANGLTLHGISEQLVISDNTVKTHVKGIYQKLGVHTRAELRRLLDPAAAIDATVPPQKTDSPSPGSQKG